jgi:Domain of unknown function (DUF4157)
VTSRNAREVEPAARPRQARRSPASADLTDGQRSPHGAANLADLQRRVGNRAVCDLLDVGQARLEVGSAWDRSEVEADAVAREVVATLRNGSPSASPQVDEEANANANDGSVIGRISRKRLIGAGGGTLDPVTEQAITAARGVGGAPLPLGTRQPMERAFGADFGHVRIHAGPESAALNDSIQATAFTMGSDIFFRGGVPDARSERGQELLAHELTHTIQQRGARPVREAD